MSLIKEKPKGSWLTYVVLLTGVYATATNLIPISVLPFVVMAVLALYLFPNMLAGKITRLPMVTFWAIIYYAISIVGVLVYEPTSLLAPEFYRYDGNFLITFIPLIALPIIKQDRRIANISLTKFAVVAIAINGLGLAYQILFEKPPTGLFLSTNAFGGFLMTAVAINYIWCKATRFGIKATCCLVIGCLLMLMSSSRGSILGIIAGIAFFELWRIGLKKLIGLALAAIVAVQTTILCFTYPAYADSPYDRYDYAVSQMSSVKGANIAIRAYENWPRGLYLFIKSPLFGTGVGSANDLPFEFSDSGVLYNPNKAPVRNYNSAHAHHSYLHIAAEQGLVGLGAFLAMWAALYKNLTSNRKSLGIKSVLMIIFWSLTVAGFTEHRLPSPSNTFPFMILFLIFWSSRLLPDGGGVRKEHIAPVQVRDDRSAQG